MANISGADRAVISLTLNNIQRDITNNVYEKIPTIALLKERGNVKILDGGERINFPVMHGTNSTAGWYDNYDVLDTTPQEGIGNVEFVWRQASVSASVSGKEKRQSSGSSRLVSIVEAKNDQAVMSLANTMNQSVFTAQTGDAMDGLPTLVAIDPTASATVGGIDQSAETWWRNQTINGASASAAFDTLLSDMRQGYNVTSAAAKGLGNIDVYITTRTVFEGYEGLVDAQRQYGNEKLLNLGFVNLAFKTAGVMFDNDCPSGSMFGLNLDTIMLAVHADANATVTEAVKPANQDAAVWQYLFMGNLVIRNRASNVVIHVIT